MSKIPGFHINSKDSTQDAIGYWSNSTTVTMKGGGSVLTQSEDIDGVAFFFDNGNISSGTFSLYGIKR